MSTQTPKPTQSLADRLLARLAPSRRRIGATPAFFQRFGVSDPFLAEEEQAGGDSMFSFLSSTRYFREMGRRGSRARILHRLADQRRSRIRRSRVRELAAPPTPPRWSSLSEELAIDRVNLVTTPAAVEPGPELVAAAPLQRAIARDAARGTSAVARELLALLAEVRGGAREQLRALADEVESVPERSQLAVLRRAMRRIRGAQRAVAMHAAEAVALRATAGAARPGAVTETAPLDVAVSRSAGPAATQGLRRVLARSPSVAVAEQPLEATANARAALGARAVARRLRAPAVAPVFAQLPVAQVVDEVRGQQAAGRAGPSGRGAAFSDLTLERQASTIPVESGVSSFVSPPPVHRASGRATSRAVLRSVASTARGLRAAGGWEAAELPAAPPLVERALRRSEVGASANARAPLSSAPLAWLARPAPDEAASPLDSPADAVARAARPAAHPVAAVRRERVSVAPAAPVAQRADPVVFSPKSGPRAPGSPAPGMAVRGEAPRTPARAATVRAALRGERSSTRLAASPVLATAVAPALRFAAVEGRLEAEAAPSAPSPTWRPTARVQRRLAAPRAQAGSPRGPRPAVPARHPDPEREVVVDESVARVGSAAHAAARAEPAERSDSRGAGLLSPAPMAHVAWARAVEADQVAEATPSGRPDVTDALGPAHRRTRGVRGAVEAVQPTAASLRRSPTSTGTAAPGAVEAGQPSASPGVIARGSARVAVGAAASSPLLRQLAAPSLLLAAPVDAASTPARARLHVSSAVETAAARAEAPRPSSPGVQLSASPVVRRGAAVPRIRPVSRRSSLDGSASASPAGLDAEASLPPAPVGATRRAASRAPLPAPAAGDGTLGAVLRTLLRDAPVPGERSLVPRVSGLASRVGTLAVPTSAVSEPALPGEASVSARASGRAVPRTASRAVAPPVRPARIASPPALRGLDGGHGVAPVGASQVTSRAALRGLDGGHGVATPVRAHQVAPLLALAVGPARDAGEIATGPVGRAASRGANTVATVAAVRRVVAEAVIGQHLVRTAPAPLGALGDRPTIEARVSRSEGGRIERAAVRRVAPGADPTLPAALRMALATGQVLSGPVEWAESRGAAPVAARRAPGGRAARRAEGVPARLGPVAGELVVRGTRPTLVDRRPPRQLAGLNPALPAGFDVPVTAGGPVAPDAAARVQARVRRPLSGQARRLAPLVDGPVGGSPRAGVPSARELPVLAFEPRVERAEVAPAWAERAEADRVWSEPRRADRRAAQRSLRRVAGGKSADRPAAAAAFSALARADRPEDLVKVILEQSNVGSLLRDLPEPAARIVDRIVQLGQRALPTEAVGGSAAASGSEAPATSFYQRQVKAKPSRRTLPATDTSYLKRGGSRSTAATATSTNGLAAGGMTKLANRLMKLIHLAEADRRLTDAQAQVSMAADSQQARSEAGHENLDGAADGLGDSNKNIEALQKEVLQAVLRELELTAQRRGEEDPDGLGIWC